VRQRLRGSGAKRSRCFDRAKLFSRLRLGLAGREATRRPHCDDDEARRFSEAGAGLEGYPQMRAGRVGEALKRLRRRPCPATLKASYSGLRCIHTLRELFLGEAGGDARINHRAGQSELGREFFVALR
jgi:hypothetical protein